MDQGLHLILIELYIKSQKSFNALKILVKLPVYHIDSNLLPFFLPSLKDEIKLFGETWREDLSLIRDPADKFVEVTKSTIVPERASTFVKNMLSSNTKVNNTQLFFIDANDYREKVGNVSFFI